MSFSSRASTLRWSAPPRPWPGVSPAISRSASAWSSSPCSIPARWLAAVLALVEAGRRVAIRLASNDGNGGPVSPRRARPGLSGSAGPLSVAPMVGGRGRRCSAGLRGLRYHRAVHDQRLCRSDLGPGRRRCPRLWVADGVQPGEPRRGPDPAPGGGHVEGRGRGHRRSAHRPDRHPRAGDRGKAATPPPLVAAAGHGRGRAGRHRRLARPHARSSTPGGTRHRSLHRTSSCPGPESPTTAWRPTSM